MGQDCQDMGMSPLYLLYLAGTSAEQEAPNGASRGKRNKNQSQHPETPLLNILVHQDTTAHPCCRLWIIFSSIQKPHTTTMCMQVALEALLCSELYSTSIIMDVASDSILLAWIEWDRDNLICRVTAPLDQHCKAILYTEECVPWLEAWWIFRAKEHVV